MKENQAKYEVSFKIVFLGDSGVGKTSILNSYLHQKFTEDTASTIGVEYTNKIIELNGKKIQLEIWDTAGQERFQSIAPIYYRKASVILLVYDITSKSSFERIKLWMKEIENNGNPNSMVVLLGNKIDLENKREEPIELTESHKIKGYDVSAKNIESVNLVFKKTITRLLKNHQQLANPSSNDSKLKKDKSGDKETEGNGKCC